jgi:hypothetical protein
MTDTPNDDRRWLVWGPDATVEYQIADDLLRIRWWQNGRPRISVWNKWTDSTDATIRKHLRAMTWGPMPQRRRLKTVRPARSRYAVMIDWFRHHLADPERR